MDDAIEPSATTLHHYLQRQREVMLFKLEGLTEEQVRRPLTPTGTNLLGLVKHLTWVELGYLGECLGRPLPEPWPWEAIGTVDDPDPFEDLADSWARADESREAIVAAYRRAWAHGDEAVRTLPQTAIAQVPWWPEERRRPTLHALLVHLIAETARHAGHADILREQLDGSIGASAENSNLPDLTPAQWAQHVDRLRRIAEEAAADRG